MLPYFELFGLSVPVYGIISVLGVIMAGWISFALAKKRSVDKYAFACTGIAAAAGLFLGSHILYGITRMGDILYIFRHFEYYNGFWTVARNILGCFDGMVFYGGLYGALFAGLFFARIRKYPIRDMSDVFAVFIPLFHTFGRVGCFFAGCCYGIKSDLGFSGRVYANGMKETTRRFPVQLAEAVCLLLLFAVLLVLFKVHKAKGKLMFVYLVSYGVLRFALEYLRGDEIRGRILMFSTSQWISILTLVWVCLYLIINKSKLTKQHKNTADSVN